MLKLGTFLSLLLLSTSAAAATDSGQWADIAIDNAKHAVSGRLCNPDTAEFRNVWAYRPVATIRAPQAVCGEVSARSGFDRYDGYRTFVWLPTDANAEPDIDHGTAFIGSEAKNLLSLCRNAMR